MATAEERLAVFWVNSLVSVPAALLVSSLVDLADGSVLCRVCSDVLIAAGAPPLTPVPGGAGLAAALQQLEHIFGSRALPPEMTAPSAVANIASGDRLTLLALVNFLRSHLETSPKVGAPRQRSSSFRSTISNDTEERSPAARINSGRSTSNGAAMALRVPTLRRAVQVTAGAGAPRPLLEDPPHFTGGGGLGPPSSLISSLATGSTNGDEHFGIKTKSLRSSPRSPLESLQSLSQREAELYTASSHQSVVQLDMHARPPTESSSMHRSAEGGGAVDVISPHFSESIRTLRPPRQQQQQQQLDVHARGTIGQVDNGRQSSSTKISGVGPLSPVKSPRGHSQTLLNFGGAGARQGRPPPRRRSERHLLAERTGDVQSPHASSADTYKRPVKKSSVAVDLTLRPNAVSSADDAEAYRKPAAITGNLGSAIYSASVKDTDPASIGQQRRLIPHASEPELITVVAAANQQTTNVVPSVGTSASAARAAASATHAPHFAYEKLDSDAHAATFGRGSTSTSASATLRSAPLPASAALRSTHGASNASHPSTASSALSPSLSAPVKGLRIGGLFDPTFVPKISSAAPARGSKVDVNGHRSSSAAVAVSSSSSPSAPSSSSAPVRRTSDPISATSGPQILASSASFQRSSQHLLLPVVPAADSGASTPVYTASPSVSRVGAPAPTLTRPFQHQQPAAMTERGREENLAQFEVARVQQPPQSQHIDRRQQQQHQMTDRQQAAYAWVRSLGIETDVAQRFMRGIGGLVPTTGGGNTGLISSSAASTGGGGAAAAAVNSDAAVLLADGVLLCEIAAAAELRAGNRIPISTLRPAPHREGASSSNNSNERSDGQGGISGAKSHSSSVERRRRTVGGVAGGGASSVAGSHFVGRSSFVSGNRSSHGSSVAGAVTVLPGTVLPRPALSAAAPAGGGGPTSTSVGSGALHTFAFPVQPPSAAHKNLELALSVFRDRPRIPGRHLFSAGDLREASSCTLANELIEDIWRGYCFVVPSSSTSLPVGGATGGSKNVALPTLAMSNSMSSSNTDGTHTHTSTAAVVSTAAASLRLESVSHLMSAGLGSVNGAVALASGRPPQHTSNRVTHASDQSVSSSSSSSPHIMISSSSSSSHIPHQRPNNTSLADSAAVGAIRHEGLIMRDGGVYDARAHTSVDAPPLPRQVEVPRAMLPSLPHQVEVPRGTPAPPLALHTDGSSAATAYYSAGFQTSSSVASTPSRRVSSYHHGTATESASVHQLQQQQQQHGGMNMQQQQQQQGHTQQHPVTAQSAYHAPSPPPFSSTAASADFAAHSPASVTWMPTHHGPTSTSYADSSPASVASRRPSTVPAPYRGSGRPSNTLHHGAAAAADAASSNVSSRGAVDHLIAVSQTQKEVIYAWLRALRLQSAASPVLDPALPPTSTSIHLLQHPLLNGTVLAELISLLEPGLPPLGGPRPQSFRSKPRSLPEARANVEAALTVLRCSPVARGLLGVTQVEVGNSKSRGGSNFNLSREIPVVLLWSTEHILSGRDDIVWALLWHVYGLYYRPSYGIDVDALDRAHSDFTQPISSSSSSNGVSGSGTPLTVAAAGSSSSSGYAISSSSSGFLGSSNTNGYVDVASNNNNGVSGSIGGPLRLPPSVLTGVAHASVSNNHAIALNGVSQTVPVYAATAAPAAAAVTLNPTTTAAASAPVVVSTIAPTSTLMHTTHTATYASRTAASTLFELAADTTSEWEMDIDRLPSYPPPPAAAAAAVTPSSVSSLTHIRPGVNALQQQQHSHTSTVSSADAVIPRSASTEHHTESTGAATAREGEPPTQQQLLHLRTTDEALMKWLSGLGVDFPLPHVSADSSDTQQQPVTSPWATTALAASTFSNGVALVRIVEACERSAGRLVREGIPGVVQKPSTGGAKLCNIRRALEVLRGVRNMPLTHLWSELDIREGEPSVIRGLLQDMRRAYG